VDRRMSTGQCWTCGERLVGIARWSRRGDFRGEGPLGPWYPFGMRRFVVAGAMVSLAACVGAAEERKAPDAADDVRTTGQLVGNPAPNFSVKALGSKETVSLKKLRGRVVLVDFWGTFCEPCKRSFPKLQELSAKYADAGLQVVGISEDEADDREKIPRFANTYGARFTLAWDDDKSIAHAYRPETMPTSFLIDKRGIVRYAHVGYHDGQEVEVEKEIRLLLAK
jgi:cytochrome c biogenesis protein CcmG/thiol:disulfide interchange protein DsbE